jgi:hypothetical protein
MGPPFVERLVKVAAKSGSGADAGLLLVMITNNTTRAPELCQGKNKTFIYIKYRWLS